VNELLVHSISNHETYPVGAHHNKFYASNGTDLRPATEDEIKKHGRTTHRLKNKDADPSVENNEAKLREVDKRSTSSIDLGACAASIAVPTKAALKSRADITETETIENTPVVMTPQMVMWVAMDRDLLAKQTAECKKKEMRSNFSRMLLDKFHFA